MSSPSLPPSVWTSQKPNTMSDPNRTSASHTISAANTNHDHHDHHHPERGHPDMNITSAQLGGDFPFSFSFTGLQEEPPLGSIISDHGTDLYSIPPRNPVTSPKTHLRSSAPSAIARGVDLAPADPARRRKPSMDVSDEESPGGQHHGPSLEDTLSDEFGLSITGPGDGVDLGGKPKEDKTGTSPAWSELKTKAGKERKRLPLACIACRRKKIRCSGEKPACKHCLRSRIPCVYKVTTRKAAPRTDYMAMLDKRLKRMEERIIKIVPKNEQDGISTSVPRANVKPAIPGTVPSGKGGARKRGADEAFGGPDFDAWVKNPMRANVESPTGTNAAAILNECEESKLLQEGAEALPDKEIQEHLADVFFESVYGQAYHILHKPSYMRKLRQVDLFHFIVES